MRIGSLCSGYGGLDLALEDFTGGSVVWHVEYERHASTVLAERFPGVPNYGDLKNFHETSVEPIDWLVAGYPCQPFSAAGLKKGVDDPRHLWPDVAKTISRLRPRRVLLENVEAHLRKGFDAVLADLAALRYDAKWSLVRASDAGAPHRRSRLFVVATSRDADEGDRGGPTPGGVEGQARSAARFAADPVSAGRAWEQFAESRGNPRPTGFARFESALARWAETVGRPYPEPLEPTIRTPGGIRLSPLFVEWLMGLPAGWVTDTPIPWSAQLRVLGNGVVPQQARLALDVLEGSKCCDTARA